MKSNLIVEIAHASNFGTYQRMCWYGRSKYYDMVIGTGEENEANLHDYS